MPAGDQETRDLDSRAAIHDAVVGFYREVVFDDLLGPVFDDVAEVDWAAHIPRLIDDWCRVLLGDPSYQGALLSSHARVHDIEPLRPEHFDRWLSMWVETVDGRWRGPKADQAKQHAHKIAGVLHRRLLDAPLGAAVPTAASPARVSACPF